MEVTVLTMDEQQMGRLFDQKIAEILNSAKDVDHEIGNWVVDRKFLELNFKWRRRKIEDLERSGKITPKFTGDGKSKFYPLDACKRIYDKEKAEFK